MVLSSEQPNDPKKWSIITDRNALENIENKSPLDDTIVFHKPSWLICEKPDKEFDKLFQAYEKISAAGGIVKGPEGFLFIKRNGVWDIPKGKVEHGEIPFEAGAREVEEECGVTVSPVRLPFVETYHTYSFKGKNVLKRTYWYAYETQEKHVLIPQTEEGITEVIWAKPIEFSKILDNTYASIKEVIEKYDYSL